MGRVTDTDRKNHPMIKAAFFDVDGTLMTTGHTMLESTRRALDALSANGIQTIVASGRPAYELPACLDGLFDTYVCLNGQHCSDAEGVYRDCPLDDADVQAVAAQVRAGAFDALVLQGDGCFATRLTQRVLDTGRALNQSYVVKNLDDELDRPIYQFCAFVDSADEYLIRDVAHGVRLTRWTELFCDIIPAQGGKGPGIRATLERYGLSPEETIAFGDGENDLSMFEVCGTAVAMGNAWDLVKERADYVTDDCDSDGIWNACKHFGLV